MEDPRLPPPAIELRRGLVPRVFNEEEAGVGSATAPASTADPREILRRDEEIHRRSCLTREAGWEADVKEAMAAADAVRYISIRTAHMYVLCTGLGLDAMVSFSNWCM